MRTLLFIKAEFADNEEIVEDIRNFISHPQEMCQELNIKEKPSFQIVEEGYTKYTKELAGEHYSALKEKPFFGELVDYMTSGKVYAMIVEGDENTINIIRTMMGATRNPAEGTIRYIIPRIYGFDPDDVTKNTIHGSDSPENAEREIAIYRKTLQKQKYYDNENE